MINKLAIPFVRLLVRLLDWMDNSIFGQTGMETRQIEFKAKMKAHNIIGWRNGKYGCMAPIYGKNNEPKHPTVYEIMEEGRRAEARRLAEEAKNGLF